MPELYMGPEHEEKASTSADSDVEQSDYEQKRELYWSKIIFCEKKFNELKPMLLQQRMNQLEKRQDDLLNRRAKDYLQKAKLVDEEFRHKREINDSYHRLRNESLQRRVRGERFCAESNMSNNRKMLKTMIRETFEKKIQDLLDEKKRSEELFFSYAKRVKNQVEVSSESEHEIPERIKQEEIRVMKYLQKKKKKKTRQPLLIYSLPYSIIQHDIAKINKSITAASSS